MASTSPSTKYIGYVGGVAVAAGVGAAIAVAGQGTAHADSTDGSATGSTSSTSQHVKAGPKRAEAKRPKPLSTVKDSVKEAVDKQAAKIEKTAARVTKTVQAAKPARPVAVKPKPKPSAEEFEAGEVAKLKDLFNPKQAAAPKPKAESEAVAQPESKTLATPKIGAVQTQADSPSGDTAWNPNPFRSDDPAPTDFPDPIMELRQALLDASPIRSPPLCGKPPSRSTGAARSCRGSTR